MSGHTEDKLVRMANQIATNLALEADPEAAVADHIRAFWTPRMIDALANKPHAGLNPLAAKAIARLRARNGVDGG